MQILKKYAWQIICVVLIIFIFLQHSCEPSKNKDSVLIIPEKKGSFNYIKPKETIRTEKYPIYINGKTIYLDNPIDSTLANLYKNERDSIQRILMYYTAIQKRNYKQTFEDKNLKVDITAMTTGTLDSLKMDYVIKKDTIKLKQPVFSALGGLSLESNIYTLEPSLKLNIGFQNKKKDVFILGGNNKEFSFTYLKNIFTIKK